MMKTRNRILLKKTTYPYPLRGSISLTGSSLEDGLIPPPGSHSAVMVATTNKLMLTLYVANSRSRKYLY